MIIKAKFDSRCGCGKEINSGDEIEYVPKKHRHGTALIFCTDCAEDRMRERESMLFDEMVNDSMNVM